jgi:hypothetical protein
MGVFHRIWGDTIPLPDMCYYVIQRSKFQDVASAILDKKLPENEISEMLGGSLIDSLAQLRYNVDRNWAREFLLADPIRDTIRLRSGNELRTLADQFSDGFWPVFEIVQSEFTSVESIADLAVTLRDSKLLAEPSAS